MGVVENLRDEASGVLSLVVLGAGFLDTFVPSLSPVSFWVVRVVGLVVLPLFAIAVGEHDRDGEHAPVRVGPTEDEPEFETRLERLLETEDVETVREYVERGRAAREPRETK